MTHRTAPIRRSAVSSGLLTAASLVVVNGSAALAGAVFARRFGKTDETDGFFAAYAVYLVLVLAANAFRVVVLPSLARAAPERRLGAEVGGWAATLACLAVPAVLLSSFGGDLVARVLTPHEDARRAFAAALAWLVPAAAAQLYAALAASALAALDLYGLAALAFAGGGLVSLAVFLVGVGGHGVIALAWGPAAGGVVALVALVAGLLAGGRLGGGLRGASLELGRRLPELARGVALPLALQGLYVVGTGFASRLGEGKVTSFSYAYLIAAFLVAATATSIALVSSVALTRTGLEGGRAAEHVVSASWLSLSLVAGAAGVFALAGGHVARTALGSDFGGGSGSELGRVVVALSPWMVASIGSSITFPLLFVAGRARRLPLLAVAALAIQVPVTWLGQRWLGLEGIAFALALTTLLVLAAQLALLSGVTLRRTARGLGWAALLCGALAVVAFGPVRLVLGAVPAAVAGLGLYVGLLAAVRPAGLLRALAYVRALG